MTQRWLEEDLYTDLTEAQERVLDFVESCIVKNCIPPTRAEIAKALGFKSPNAAQEHLAALAKKERIELVPGISRGIKLLQAR